MEQKQQQYGEEGENEVTVHCNLDPFDDDEEQRLIQLKGRRFVEKEDV